MIFHAYRGDDIKIDATDRVIVRIQDEQWWLDTPSNGIAVLSGDRTRGLRYYGGRMIDGDIWVGKTHHQLFIEWKE